ncbi:MAG: FCD domain-containing protein [Pseudomonadota bacterium]
MALQAVATRRLYEQIAEQISDLIGRGEFQPGSKLPAERDLALTLGVSRPTVREALIALELADLVEVRVGVGVFVRKNPGAGVQLPSSKHSPLEVTVARALIEPGIAAMAATAMTDEGSQQLDTCLDTLRQATERDEWSEEADRQLHLCLADHCGNGPLREIDHALWHERLDEVNARWHRHLASVPGLLRTIMTQHEEIVSAVQDADPERASTAMKRHLDHVRRQMEGLWE